MGNRAVVFFFEKDENRSDAPANVAKNALGAEEPSFRASPGIYLHWNGDVVKDWLKKAAPTMRAGDPSYASARFCGYCHERIKGGLSLGLFPPPTKLDPEYLGSFSDGYSPGDAGVFAVDVNTGVVTNYGGSEDEGGGGEPFKINLGKF